MSQTDGLTTYYTITTLCKALSGNKITVNKTSSFSVAFNNSSGSQA